MKVINLSEQPSLLNQFLKEMRSIDTQKDSMRFRRNIERIGEMMAVEISRTFTYAEEEVQTPLAIAKIDVPQDKVVLGTLLRAGLPMHQGFLNMMDGAENAFISAYRQETIGRKGETQIEIISEYKFTHPVLSKIDFSKKVIFMTAHRRENLGEPLQNICNAVKEIAKKNKDIEVVYPVHLNPAVQDVATKVLGEVKNVHLIEPLDVITTHNLINRSYMVLTDSGGIQEEAPSLGKPVLVLRGETERPEAVAAGTVKIVGTNKQTIIDETMKLLTDEEEYKKMSRALNPYGDGNACDRIVDAIQYYFGMTETRPEDLKY